MINAYGSQPVYGFQGPVVAAIDIQPPPAGLATRVSLSTAAASCSGSYHNPTGVRVVSLNGLERYVISGVHADVFKAWLCGYPDGLPRNESMVNITYEAGLLGLAPLQAGPYVTLVLTFPQALESAHQTVMQEALCTAIWDTLDSRCTWLVTSATPVWVSVTARRSSQPEQVWKMSFQFIERSNAMVARASYKLAQLVNSDVFRSLYPLKEPAYYATVTSPSVKYAQSSIYGCATHYDCQTGYFCSLSALQIYGSAYTGGPAACDQCQYCLSDYIDAIDKWCPRDKCGATSGGYPACIDAQKMLQNYSCPSSYNINMSKIPGYLGMLGQVKNSSQAAASTSDGRIKARFMTPFNQLVGALTITQRRVNGTCTYKNDNVGRYSAMKDPAQGLICRGDSVDYRPFGYDPAFLSSSPMYDGTLEATLYYSVGERDPLSVKDVPYGFFPHKYDGQNHTHKKMDLIIPNEANNFKLYFEERLNGAHAQKLLTYMQYGGFIDSQTESLMVDAVTLNSQLNVFAKVSFAFTWQVNLKFFLERDGC